MNHDDCKVLFILGDDEMEVEEMKLKEGTFVVYLGHTGDEGAYYADLILPGASYLEK
jgi:NADH dehydrogenase/NADH:ubiquinone oxidoreductase subunit G